MKVCTCPSTCWCWYRAPGRILACGCGGEPARHPTPEGCRYRDDTDGWLATYPGVDGAVMVCLTHGGLAAGEAYENPTTTAPCVNGHLPHAARALKSLRRFSDQLLTVSLSGSEIQAVLDAAEPAGDTLRSAVRKLRKALDHG